MYRAALAMAAGLEASEINGLRVDDEVDDARLDINRRRRMMNMAE